MILFMGPPGSGKSVQGQIMAARHGWRWLSAGQMLRDSHDPKVLDYQRKGEMVPNDITHQIVSQAIARSKDVNHLVSDGFPRQLEQAKWLIEELPKHQRSIAGVIVFKVPRDEIERRLKIRGRADDAAEVIADRNRLYHIETEPILDFYQSLNIPVKEIDGVGSVGQVHDRIQKAIEECLQP